MVNKITYRALCEKETTIPIFSKAWWLDAVVGEKNWEVIVHEKGNDVIASLPYVIKKKCL